MIESIKEFWYMWLILIVLVAVLLVVMKKASAAMKKRNSILAKHREEVERFKSLVDKYSSADGTLLLSADAAEVAEGITAVLQYKLEKSTDPDADYNNAPGWKREVYALYYFSEDCKQSLSYFFKNNGEPLVSVLVSAVKNIGYDKIYPTVSQMFSMYDENNESVSLDKTKVAELDEEFSNIFDTDEFFELVRKYAAENYDK